MTTTGFSVPSWEQIKTPLLVVGIIVAIVIVIVLILLLVNKNRRQLTPLELFIKNLKASTIRVPARGVKTTGSKTIPAAKLGKLLGVVPAAQLTALKVRPSGQRAGFWASLFGSEMVLTSPSDNQDLRGKTLTIRSLGVMRYTHDLFWVLPDLEDESTRVRWARVLHLDPAAPSEALLPKVEAYFVHAIASLMAPQEALAAADINARGMRAVSFGDPDAAHGGYREPEARGPAPKQNPNDGEDELGASPQQGAT